jgi:hypothetical protein
LLNQTPTEEETSDGGHESVNNYRFAYPRGWRVDSKIKKGLGANLAMARSEPSAGLAIFAHDYKTRSPRNADLHDQAITWLEKYFRGFEFESKPEGILDDQPARRLDFQGEVDNVLINGECLMTARRGFGYWLVTWGPAEQGDEAAAEWQIVRGRFHFLNNREGWTEKKPEQIPVQGEKAAYRLSYAKGVWEKLPIEGLDPAADVLLRGYDPKDADRLADRAGLVTILKLPQPEGDAKTAAIAARDYLLKKQREIYPETTIEVVTDKNGTSDGLTSFAGYPGHLAKLRVKNSAGRELYVELATIPITDGLLLVQCECLWHRQEFFKQEFAPLRESLKPGKGR